jgi:hypothetical protein
MKKAVLSCVMASVAGLAALSGTASAATEAQGTEAGYQAMTADIGASIRTVTASWVEPKVIPRGKQDEYASMFAGFDNSADTGLAPPCCTGAPGSAQVGTDADSLGGRASYYAWYSPANGGFGRVIIKKSVRPGDHMSASVTAGGAVGLNDTLKLTDVRYRAHRKPLAWTVVIRTGDSYNLNQAQGAVFGLAPPPLATGGNSLLADVGTVRFTDVTINGHVIGSYKPNLDQYELFGICAPIAISSSLGRGGDNFAVTWRATR